MVVVKKKAAESILFIAEIMLIMVVLVGTALNVYPH